MVSAVLARYRQAMMAAGKVSGSVRRLTEALGPADTVGRVID